MPAQGRYLFCSAVVQFCSLVWHGEVARTLLKVKYGFYTYLGSMNNGKTLTLFIIFYVAVMLKTAAQNDVQNRRAIMHGTTKRVLDAIAADDTAALINMLDTGYNHLSKPHARSYMLSDILQKCRQFKKITAAFTMPPLDSLHFATDRTNGANLSILYLTGPPDTALNIRRCAFVVSFFPTRFFPLQLPGQCLTFYFYIIPISNKTPGLPQLQLPIIKPPL